MSEFHLFFRTLQGELWEAGPAPSPTLEAMLACLAAAPLPEGVSRLPSARMTPGPHLTAQDAADSTPMDWVEARDALRARSALRAMGRL